MSSLFSKALVYLGLVDEDQVDDGAGNYRQDPGSDSYAEPYRQEPAPERRPNRQDQQNVHQIAPEGRRIEPPASASRTSSFRGTGASTIAGVRPVREPEAEILVVEEFADARVLADRVRDRIPVVMDFRLIDDSLIRRIVDFSSGLIYALNGTMTKVGNGLVLVSPQGVSLDAAEKRRLASLGAYQLPLDD